MTAPTSAVARGPLAGTRVVSLALQLPGPYCGKLLADLGADVIVVEPLGGGDPARWAGQADGDASALFEAFNRNKRSMALNLKSSAGREVLSDLLGTADALLEGFRPGVAERLGIGREAIQRDHPDLLHASISGYGQTGPSRDHTGHEISYLGRAAISAPSIMTRGGEELPLPMADLASGALTAVGVLAGLLGRASTGRGEYIDIAMSEVVLSWTAPIVEARLNGDRPATLNEPAYGVFRCGDGRSVTLSIAFEDHFWRELCDVLGLAALSDLEPNERRARCAELREAISRRLSSRGASTWVTELAERGVPVGLVADVDDVVADPHFTERGMFATTTTDAVRARRALASPLTPVELRSLPVRPAPRLGEHTEEILRELGYARDTIDELRRSHVIN